MLLVICSHETKARVGTIGVQLIDGDDEHCSVCPLMSEYRNSVQIRKVPPAHGRPENGPVDLGGPLVRQDRSVQKHGIKGKFLLSPLVVSNAREANARQNTCRQRQYNEIRAYRNRILCSQPLDITNSQAPGPETHATGHARELRANAASRGESPEHKQDVASPRGVQVVRV